MIRRAQWKFITCPVDPPQLFNLSADPRELVNLAINPSNAAEKVILEHFMKEAEQRWDFKSIHAEVLRSQRARRAVLVCSYAREVWELGLPTARRCEGEVSCPLPSQYDQLLILPGQIHSKPYPAGGIGAPRSISARRWTGSRKATRTGTGDSGFRQSVAWWSLDSKIQYIRKFTTKGESLPYIDENSFVKCVIQFSCSSAGGWVSELETGNCTVILHSPMLNIRQAASWYSVEIRCSAYSRCSFRCCVWGPLTGSKIS